MHAHFGDPLVVDANYFYRLPPGKRGLAIEEGYRIFDLDNPTKVVDISGAELGQVQVTRTMQTKISFLGKQDFRFIKSAGLKSKEEMVRILRSHYSKERVEWITFIWFTTLGKLFNRRPAQKKEEKDGGG